MELGDLMIVSFLWTVITAQAQPMTREWRVADRAIHSTCKNVNSHSELMVSYESQSGVVEHSRLLAHTTIMGLESIRLQTEQDRLTAPQRVEIELRMLSQSVLGSMLSIQKQTDKLDLFVDNLSWLQETAIEQTLENDRTRRHIWRQLCHTQARQTSKVAWQTYEMLMEELMKLQIMTARVSAANTLTLASAT